jgi:hypothetical protein
MINLKNYEDKVIHCKTRKEHEELVAAMVEQGYQYAIPFQELKDFMESFIEEYGEDGCWRICTTRGIAYNESVDHWIDNGYEIIDFDKIF